MRTRTSRTGSFDPALRPGVTRIEALRLTRRAFAEAGLEDAALDARILLLDALGIGATEFALRPEEPVGAPALARICESAARRLAREPVSRILGEREFWGLTFELSPATLVPRPDTETVVEAALALVPDRTAPLRVLDLGTGSGCLLVALLHELPNAEGLGIDRSVEALAIARRNAQRSAVAERARFAASDWVAAIRGRYDLIVSNPPYIARRDLASLAEEVRLHDPKGALDGGLDGLDGYRAILAGAREHLNDRGFLVLEIGLGQESSLRRLAAAAGFEVATVANDLGSRARAVVLGAAEGLR